MAKPVDPKCDACKGTGRQIGLYPEGIKCDVCAGTGVDKSQLPGWIEYEPGSGFFYPGPDAVCECGHTRAEHDTIDFGGSTRGVECTGDDGGCSCIASFYGAH